MTCVFCPIKATRKGMCQMHYMRAYRKSKEKVDV